MKTYALTPRFGFHKDINLTDLSNALVEEHGIEVLGVGTTTLKFNATEGAYRAISQQWGEKCAIEQEKWYVTAEASSKKVVRHLRGHGQFC